MGVSIYPGEAPYLGTINSASAQYGVPQSILAWVINQESSFNPTAQSYGSNAYGIAQIEPATAAQYGVNPANPTASINFAAQYLSSLYQKTGSWLGAVTSYGTLAPSNWAGGTSSLGYQNALAGFNNAASGIVNTNASGLVGTAGAAANAALTSLNPLSSLFSFFGNPKAFIDRGSFALVGVLLLAAGLFALVGGPKVVVDTVKKASKGAIAGAIAA